MREYSDAGHCFAASMLLMLEMSCARAGVVAQRKTTREQAINWITPLDSAPSNCSQVFTIDPPGGQLTRRNRAPAEHSWIAALFETARGSPTLLTLPCYRTKREFGSAVASRPTLRFVHDNALARWNLD